MIDDSTIRYWFQLKSDGSCEGTYLKDPNGITMGLINKITWTLDASDPVPLAKMTVEVINVPAELAVPSDRTEIITKSVAEYAKEHDLTSFVSNIKQTDDATKIL